MTEKQAEKVGYYVVEGSYNGTSDDRIGRWYVTPIGSPIDKRGPGWPSKKEALEALEDRLKRDDAWRAGERAWYGK